MMKLYKKNVLNYANNDVYLIDKIDNKITINNNYQGLIYLDTSLQEKEHIQVNTELFPVVPIECVFKSADQQEILLYCSDDEVLVYVNLRHKKPIIIDIKNVEVLSNSYYWKDSSVVIASYNGRFYKVNLNKLNIEEADPASIDQRFYYFCEEGKKYRLNHRLYDANFAKQYFIYKEDGDVVLWDKGQKTKIKAPKNLLYHDVVYSDGIFAFISEEKVVLIRDQEKIVLPCTSMQYSFLRGRFFKNIEGLFFILLMRNNCGYGRRTVYSYYVSL